MNNESEARKRFQADAAGHQMQVLQDDGVFRHLHFSRDKSFAYHFTLTTWPGYLCIAGDMGCFVFSRTWDMFNFFSSKEGKINPSYWAQKLQTDKNGCEEFSERKFKNAIARDFFTTKFESKDKKRRVWQEVKEQVLSEAENGHYAAVRAAMDFVYYDDDFSKSHGLFEDFYEHDLKEYTFHFLWCLHAIVWGIQQYDTHKTEKAPRLYWVSAA